MIDVRDMMIGNWIRDDKYDAITTLEPCCAYQAILNGCSGIPVTVDMLKRIGFEKCEDSPLERNFYRYWDKEYRYKLDVHPDFCNSDRKFSIHIDNEYCETIGCGEFNCIQELQNLVRVITGQNLPITKEMIDGNIDE